MDCKNVSGFVGAYVDGEFDEAEKAEVDAHLATCPSCLALIHGEARFRAAVRAAAPLRAPEGLRDRISLRLAQEPLPPRGARRLLHPATIAAAAGVAGVVGWLVFFQEERARVAEEAVLRHARGLPMEIVGADVQQIHSWLEGKVDFHARLPIFANVAIPLLGARLSHIRDRQAAYLVYGSAQGRRMSLFVFDDPDLVLHGVVKKLKDREVFLQSARGYNVATWKRAEIVYSLVSDLDEPAILSLIEHAEER